MTTKHQRILLFDIDGTLMDSTGEGTISMGRALQDVYGTTGPIETYNMAGKTDWQIITELMQLAGLGTEMIEASRPAAFAAYAHHVEIAAVTFKMRLLPGVESLLERLANDPTFLMGLVTGNTREAVPHKLRTVGIDPSLFKFGAFGSEHIDRNTLPSLALYRLSQMLGSPVLPESALVIGDTPRDIICARHAGIKVLCAATGQYDRETLEALAPDYLLDDLSDTEVVMDILNHY